MARERTGLSTEEVSDRLDKEATWLEEVENGEVEVNAQELLELAEIFEIPTRDLIEGKDPEGDVVTRFRSRPELDQQTLQVAVRDALQATRTVADLRELLGEERRFESPYTPRPTRASWQASKREGIELARRERERLSLGTAPVDDLHHLILEQGIGVAEHELPEDISGVYLAGGELWPFILLNGQDSGERRRFSLAHEFCHALVDWDEDLIVSHRDDDSLGEARANAFAGALLLPKEGILEFCASREKGPGDLGLNDVADLAYKFGTSYQAAYVQLHARGLISSSHRDELARQEWQAKGYWANKHPLKPTRFVEMSLAQWAFALMLKAYRKTLISRRRAFEIGEELDFDEEVVKDSLDASEPREDDWT